MRVLLGQLDFAMFKGVTMRPCVSRLGGGSGPLQFLWMNGILPTLANRTIAEILRYAKDQYNCYYVAERRPAGFYLAVKRGGEIVTNQSRASVSANSRLILNDR
jgi:hypothetical protein